MINDTSDQTWIFSLLPQHRWGFIFLCKQTQGRVRACEVKGKNVKKSVWFWRDLCEFASANYSVENKRSIQTLPWPDAVPVSSQNAKHEQVRKIFPLRSGRHHLALRTCKQCSPRGLIRAREYFFTSSSMKIHEPVDLLEPEVFIPRGKQVNGVRFDDHETERFEFEAHLELLLWALWQVNARTSHWSWKAAPASSPNIRWGAKIAWTESFPAIMTL